jgi:hypothetical protein
MLPFSRPVSEIIRQRYSCRAYNKTPVATEQGRKEDFGYGMETINTHRIEPAM